MGTLTPHCGAASCSVFGHVENVDLRYKSISHALTLTLVPSVGLGEFAAGAGGGKSLRELFGAGLFAGVLSRMRFPLVTLFPFVTFWMLI
jgi:hypothetical protein